MQTVFYHYPELGAVWFLLSMLSVMALTIWFGMKEDKKR